MLENKKILMLCVQTFGYEIAIKSELERQGAEVIYYDERPSNSNFSKGLIRLYRPLYEKRINKYYDMILQAMSTVDLDFLFVIRGEVVPNSFLESFKKLHPSCKLIFFTWDSFSNHSHALSILPFFDNKSTFDSADAEKHDMMFRPLFYLDGYCEVESVKHSSITYDVMFAGTAHSDRFQVSNKINEWCDSNNLNSYFFYYQHGKLVDVYKRIFDSAYTGVPFSKLSFKSITPAKMLELYRQSRVVLDIQHPGQTGLTMRIFEALGAGRKVITTNRSVENYTFFNPANIKIISRENFSIDLEFVESEFVELDPEIKSAMSIAGWVEEIFSPNRVGCRWLKAA